MTERKFLFLGDSITDAGHLWDDDPLMLGQGFVRKIHAHPKLSDARCINRGQDGFTCADLLRLTRQLTALDDYDCITILIGINDVSVARYADPAWIPDKFERTIHDILTLIRRFHKKRLFLMEPFLFVPPAEHMPLLSLLQEEQRILQEAAAVYHAEYIPLQKLLEEAVVRHGLWNMTTDGIHLTDCGNQLLASQWLTTFFSKA